jgi:hypothetical protein
MKYVVIALTEPNHGRAAEYNEYYEHRHLDDVLMTTGWSHGQRFKLIDQQGTACPLPYLAFYELEADDPAGVLQKLNATRAQRPQSDALNRSTAGVWVFEAIGPRHTHPCEPRNR